MTHGAHEEREGDGLLGACHCCCCCCSCWAFVARRICRKKNQGVFLMNWRSPWEKERLEADGKEGQKKGATRSGQWRW